MCYLAVKIVISLWLSEPSSLYSQTTSKFPENFKIRTGVNISHWLSQSEKRGEARRDYANGYFTKDTLEK